MARLLHGKRIELLAPNEQQFEILVKNACGYDENLVNLVFSFYESLKTLDKNGSKGIKKEYFQPIFVSGEPVYPEVLRTLLAGRDAVSYQEFFRYQFNRLVKSVEISDDISKTQGGFNLLKKKVSICSITPEKVSEMHKNLLRSQPQTTYEDAYKTMLEFQKSVAFHEFCHVLETTEFENERFYRIGAMSFQDKNSSQTVFQFVQPQNFKNGAILENLQKGQTILEEIINEVVTAGVLNAFEQRNFGIKLHKNFISGGYWNVYSALVLLKSCGALNNLTEVRFNPQILVDKINSLNISEKTKEFYIKQGENEFLKEGVSCQDLKQLTNFELLTFFIGDYYKKSCAPNAEPFKFDKRKMAFEGILTDAFLNSLQNRFNEIKSAQNNNQKFDLTRKLDDSFSVVNSVLLKPNFAVTSQRENISDEINHSEQPLAPETKNHLFTQDVYSNSAIVQNFAGEDFKHLEIFQEAIEEYRHFLMKTYMFDYKETLSLLPFLTSERNKDNALRYSMNINKNKKSKHSILRKTPNSEGQKTY